MQDSANTDAKKFSTLQGVFIPIVISTIGVVIFLRANFIIGHAGIYQALGILFFATGITALTSLSISAIATNTDVKDGGIYYLISRSIGPEFGAIIGLTIFMSQAIAIPFYILGFSEAVVSIIPQLVPYRNIVAFAAFGAVVLLSFKDAKFILKNQIAVLVIIGLAIASFIIGAAINFNADKFAENAMPLNSVAKFDYLSSLSAPFSFWILFALFFPAVTGILAGVNMSGKLKNPTRSIPKGMLFAIFAVFVVYAAQIILCGGAFYREELILYPYIAISEILYYVTIVLVFAGVFAAALGGALAMLLSTPYILQTLAHDKILKPVNIFAKTSANGEPRRALIFTHCIGLAVIYFATRNGDAGAVSLNLVAIVVSMFYLLTYGIINYAAFVESFSRNPSFRPRFKIFHWTVALVGAVASFAAILFINITSALIALIIFGGVFLYVRKFVMASSFGDARRGFIYSRTRDNLLTLTNLPTHAKNWRPTIAAFVGNPEKRGHIVRYADWLSNGRGILTIATLVRGVFAEKIEERKRISEVVNKVLNRERIKAFPEILVTPDFDLGVNQLLQSHSIGPVKPNLAIWGWSSDSAHAESFVSNIKTAARLNMNVGLICGNLPPSKERGKERKIDIWWRGMRNGSLMMILAHLLSLNSEWSGANIRILRVVGKEEEVESATEELRTLTYAARMDVEIKTILSADSFPVLLRQNSGESTVIFLGFQVDENTEAQKFQSGITELLRHMPTTILVQSTGDADLLS